MKNLNPIKIIVWDKYGEPMCNEVKKAVTLCTKHNEWELAVNLAKEYSIPEMDSVLSEYVNRLIQDNRVPQAIEVYQKANKYLEAAILAYDYGKEFAKTARHSCRVKIVICEVL